MKNPAFHHRSHDYAFLMKEWKSLAKRGGLKMKAFAKADELPIHVITSANPKNDPRETLYISAGVHGDESAPPWALLHWAEENLNLLRERRFLIFPCMNPHGLMRNTRADQRGIDINRTFHDVSEPMIAAWKAIVQEHKLGLCLNLHEDYDARGLYLYEITAGKEIAGHRILSDCSKIIPIDDRRMIEGRKADRGLINPKRIPTNLPGMPEAIILYQMGASVSLTFETPSELCIEDRIAAQKKFIASSLRHADGL
jgi:murein peptide amidase A